MSELWKLRLLKFWRNWCQPLLVVLIVLSTFRSAIADWNDVPTGSMRPTILEGDRIFVNKLAYDLKLPFTLYRLARWADPRRGDVVILFSPENGDRLVKRVIAVPGDRLFMRHNRVYINDEPLSYGPADPECVNQIDPAQRRHHVFVTETVDAHAHPVMMTPPASARRTFGPVTLGADEYFVMGDNRDNSKDSRFFGTADRSQIVGRVQAVVLSLDRDHYYLPRWKRFFQSIP